MRGMRALAARRAEFLDPINARRAAVVGGVGDTGFTEARIHDVLAMRRAREPAFCGLGRTLWSRGDVFPDQQVAIAGAGDALRRGAAVVALVREIIVLEHLLRVRFGRAAQQYARLQRWRRREALVAATPGRGPRTVNTL